MGRIDVPLDVCQANVHMNFPSSSWLSNEQHVKQFLIWSTYYTRNPHRFCKEYLNISLHWYQAILLYLMFHCRLIVIIAARASAKSFIVAVYAVCRAILFPNSRIVITAGVKGQSEVIISEKIKQELCNKSPMLRLEIKRITDSQNDTGVYFHNGSSIEVVVCSENALGHRSTVNVGEEAKKINKNIMDRVISPFRIVRQIPFMSLPEYDGDERFVEEPVEIYISSSIEDTHWLYKMAKDAFQSMIRGEDSFFIAFDYSITLRHGIRTRRQMIDDHRKFDPITWAVEYENAVLRENTKAYFSYNELRSCQKIQKAFYPRKPDDVINHVRNRYAIPKMDGEIRIVAADIAFVNRAGNDNSCFTCMRLLPDSDDHGQKIYLAQVPYIETIRGEEMRKQAIRIRQLYEDFDSDYIVLDTRSAGLGVFDLLARVLYDDERGIEYPPLTSMNDEVFAARINNPAAEPRIFCVNASLKFNSDVAINFKSMMLQHQIEFLIPKDDGVNELCKYVPEYNKPLNPEDRLLWEQPYLETMLMISETSSLQYEKAENTGLIKIREQGNATKDRYSSCSYAAYFASLLARDILNNEEDATLESAPMLVSSILF